MIDRKQAYEWFAKRAKDTPMPATKAMFEMAADALSTVDAVEVVHGYWVLLDECANEGVYCSVCHKKVYSANYANQKIKSNYCPNCGAKMDGERKDRE